MCSRFCLQRWNRIIVHKPMLRGIDFHPQTLKPLHKFRVTTDVMRTTDILNDQNDQKSLCRGGNQVNEGMVTETVRNALCKHLLEELELEWPRLNAFGMIRAPPGKQKEIAFHTQITMDESQQEFVGCVIPNDVLDILSSANYQDIQQFEQHFQIKMRNKDQEKDDEEGGYDVMGLLWNMVENKDQNQMWEFQIERNNNHI